MRRKLKSQPIGTIIEATDPDGDRLIVCEIEDASRAEILENLGVDFLDLGDNRLLTIYTPNQAFLMLSGLLRQTTQNFWTLGKSSSVHD